MCCVITPIYLKGCINFFLTRHSYVYSHGIPLEEKDMYNIREVREISSLIQCKCRACLVRKILSRKKTFCFK